LHFFVAQATSQATFVCSEIPGGFSVLATDLISRPNNATLLRELRLQSYNKNSHNSTHTYALPPLSTMGFMSSFRPANERSRQFKPCQILLRGCKSRALVTISPPTFGRLPSFQPFSATIVKCEGGKVK